MYLRKIADNDKDEYKNLNWIATNETAHVDFRAWQRYFGFDRNGIAATATLDIDIDRLEMHGSLNRDLPASEAGAAFMSDFFEQPAGPQRTAGPFAQFGPVLSKYSIDPRSRGSE